MRIDSQVFQSEPQEQQLASHALMLDGQQEGQKDGFQSLMSQLMSAPQLAESPMMQSENFNQENKQNFLNGRHQNLLANDSEQMQELHLRPAGLESDLDKIAQVLRQQLGGKQQFVQGDSTALQSEVDNFHPESIEKFSEYLLKTMPEKEPTQLETAKVFAPKSLDLSSVQPNNKVLIDQIIHYIDKSKLNLNSKVNFQIDHHEFGKIDVQLHKDSEQQLQVSFITDAKSAQKVLNDSREILISRLEQDGFKVQDFVVEMSKGKSLFNSISANEDSSNSSFEKNESQDHSFKSSDQQKNKNSEQNPERQRRNELWELLQEQRSAA